jgi:hypothetical protein
VYVSGRFIALPRIPLKRASSAVELSHGRSTADDGYVMMDGSTRKPELAIPRRSSSSSSDSDYEKPTTRAQPIYVNESFAHGPMYVNGTVANNDSDDDDDYEHVIERQVMFHSQMLQPDKYRNHMYVNVNRKVCATKFNASKQS